MGRLVLREGFELGHEESPQGWERRTFLKRAAIVGGATVWAAPTVQSLMSPAFATGTGPCPPGRLVRFKYDVDTNRFDSGDAGGGGSSWCLPDGYADADVSVSGEGNVGCYTVDGVTQCISVSVSEDGKTAQVVLPDGTRIEDLQAKAGNSTNGECDDFDYQTGSTAVVTLDDKSISFVAGVICA
ncbi:MAG: twin-arginine translocation signal domain-containing protein [Propionibacteriales bacterium]|nr:twin-arginine translocation signal domain-containing protein [Propionibacteriales bacterium]